MDTNHYFLKTYKGSNCANATQIPCWVPLMKDLVDVETQKDLEKCSTLFDYNCEKQVLYQSMIDAGLKCLKEKPCEKMLYKVAERDVLQFPKEHQWVRLVALKLSNVNEVKHQVFVCSITWALCYHFRHKWLLNARKRGYIWK